LISSSSGADARLARLEQRLNQLADDVKAADTPHTVRVDKSPPKRAPAVRRGPPKSGPRIMPAASPSQQHTVVSGDTLSKIAAGHYGGSSMRFVNAIFDANRALLTSPDQLRPGMELVLPTIEGVITPRSAKSSASLETDNRRTSLPQPEVPRTPSRWYQIQQDDRYVSIAREQLGDARRWPEIHELNKDKFPDPGLIRTGVRIRLPLKLVAAATERRR
jgi:nucleoid-associated protein YgaU